MKTKWNDFRINNFVFFPVDALRLVTFKTMNILHYEMESYENPVNIFMVYLQGFQMFLMSFS